MPRPLIMFAAPLAHPSVGRAAIAPCCQMNGTQAPEDGNPIAWKPQKSSASVVAVCASPTAWPAAFTPKARLFLPPSPGWFTGICDPLYQSTPFTTPPGPPVAPDTMLLLVT